MCLNIPDDPLYPPKATLKPETPNYLRSSTPNSIPYVSLYIPAQPYIAPASINNEDTTISESSVWGVPERVALIVGNLNAPRGPQCTCHVGVISINPKSLNPYTRLYTINPLNLYHTNPNWGGGGEENTTHPFPI